MNLRRVCVFEENPREGTPLIQVKAYLPVAESFGFVSALRQQTSGQAFPQCVFDHWENIPGNAMQEGKLQDLILACRKRKNMKVEMPKLADYLDKLLSAWDRQEDLHLIRHLWMMTVSRNLL